jgi:hypothetical protein
MGDNAAKLMETARTNASATLAKPILSLSKDGKPHEGK